MGVVNLIVRESAGRKLLISLGKYYVGAVCPV